MFEFRILQVTCRFNFHSIHNDALVSMINAYYEYFYYTTLSNSLTQKPQFRYHFIWKQSSTKYIALGKSLKNEKEREKVETNLMAHFCFHELRNGLDHCNPPSDLL